MKTNLAALVLSAPCLACAAPPSVDMSCGLPVKEFFAPLIQNRVISPKPIAVSDKNSVNEFRLGMFKRLTVYGMPVTGVVGYTDDPLLFVRRGDSPSRDVYGVIVRESIANVQAQLNSVNATAARTYRIDATSTAIVCKGEM